MTTHHTWINSLGGNWSNLYVPPAADFIALDNGLASLLNGDGGGTWTPAFFIGILGDVHGIWFEGLTLLESGAECFTAGDQSIVHGDSDYELLGSGHSGATRTVRCSCLGSQSVYGFSPGISDNSAQIQSVAVGARLVVPLRVHEGATLVSAVLTFQVGRNHTAVPAFLPGFRVCQRDQSGNVTPLVASGGDANGFVYPATPGSGSAWFDSNNPQTITYTCAAGIVIDRSQYTYFAEIVDESGVGSLNENLYNDILLTFDDITDTRPA